MGTETPRPLTSSTSEGIPRRVERIDTDVMLQALDADARAFRRPWVDLVIRIVVPVVALIVGLVALVACAGKPAASVGIAGAYRGLAVVRLDVHDSVETYEEAVALSIEHCAQAHGAGSPEQRQCLLDLGWTAEGLDNATAAIGQVSKAYNRTADGLDELERAWSKALPVFEHARRIVKRLRP